ncbi:hypothetical protein CPC08DRAFT_730288, partial [Agrocybe pediades]
MSTSKTQSKGSSSKSRSASGSKDPSINLESAPANKKHSTKKRVTIEEVQPDPQESVGSTSFSRTGGPTLEFATLAASSAASETGDLPGFRGDSTTGGSFRSMSETPSFSSLANNDNSVNSEHTIHATLTESSPIFKGISVAEDIPLYDEPIHNSIVRYHESFDPLSDRDPLEEFGAVNGYLPDRPAEEAMMLRDIVIRWTYPHLMCLWQDLPQGVKSFLKARVAITELVAYDLSNDSTFSPAKTKA